MKKSIRLRDEIGVVTNELLSFYSPEEANLWLTSPHEMLQGETALSRIKNGRSEDVLAVIDRLKSGAYL